MDIILLYLYILLLKNISGLVLLIFQQTIMESKIPYEIDIARFSVKLYIHYPY